MTWLRGGAWFLFVGPQCATSFVSQFWPREFRGGSCIFGKFCAQLDLYMWHFRYNPHKKLRTVTMFVVQLGSYTVYNSGFVTEFRGNALPPFSGWLNLVQINLPQSNSVTLKMRALLSSETSEQTRHTTRCKNRQNHRQSTTKNIGLYMYMCVCVFPIRALYTILCT
jgi:hypothetical protein